MSNVGVLDQSPSVDTAVPEAPLIFLHIPKTAGSTLWHVLRRQYGADGLPWDTDWSRQDALTPVPWINAYGGGICWSDVAAVPEEQWRDVRVLSGHTPYGGHPLYATAPCFTLLRNPAERVLSHYSHIARTPDHPSRLLAPHTPGKPPTLDEFLRCGAVGVDNLQTRMLAGPEAMAIPFGQCDRAVFEQAKHNLVHGIAVAGLTERFDETLILMQRRFGWRLPRYTTENVGANRLHWDQVPNESRRRIWALTHWDRRLYALAVRRFYQAVAAEGPAFGESLARLWSANARSQQAGPPVVTPQSRAAILSPLWLRRVVRPLVGRFLARPR